MSHSAYSSTVQHKYYSYLLIPVLYLLQYSSMYSSTVANISISTCSGYYSSTISTRVASREIEYNVVTSIEYGVASSIGAIIRVTDYEYIIEYS
jgi:hypothetical protein